MDREWPLSEAEGLGVLQKWFCPNNVSIHTRRQVNLGSEIGAGVWKLEGKRQAARVEAEKDSKKKKKKEKRSESERKWTCDDGCL